MSSNPFRQNPFRQPPDESQDQLTAAELFELFVQVERLRKTAAWLEGDVEAPPEARSVAAALREVLDGASTLGHVDVLDTAVTGYGRVFGRYCDEAAEESHRAAEHREGC